MSVNTSEEYLDELLQAVEPIIYKNDPVLETSAAETALPAADQKSAGITAEREAESQKTEKIQTIDAETEIAVPMTSGADHLEPVEAAPPMESEPEAAKKAVVEEAGEIEMKTEPEPLEQTADSDSISVNDLLASFVSEQSAQEEEETDIDAMLNAAASSAAGTEKAPSDYDTDIKELLKQFTDDEDLSDIGETLDRNDHNETIDKSILTAQEEDSIQPGEELEEDNLQQPKEKKGLFSFFKKKLRKKDRQQEEVLSEENTKLEELHDQEDNLMDSQAELQDDPDITLMPDMDLAGEEVTEVSAPESELNAGDINLDGIFEDDKIDIDQILSAGLFADSDIPEKTKTDAAEEIEEKAGKKLGKAKKENKKESFFTRLITMLTEEEEEEPEENRVPEASETGITDENEAILAELSKEEKKKRKKDQKKKEKQAKKKGKEQPEGEESEEGEENSGKKNKKDKKDKKKKKNKKEKVSNLEEIPERPQKKLSLQKVIPVFALCFSVLALILIIWAVLPGMIKAKEARWAFDNADYETCYGNLYGEKRSEKDEEIFQKSYIILCVQRKWDSYETLKQMGMEVEALDALFEGVRVYRDMDERAESYGVLGRITPIFETIYSQLRNYGLSEAEIEEILAYESRVAYTKRLESIVNGTPFVMNEWLPAAGELGIEQTETEGQQSESDHNQTVPGMSQAGSDQPLEDVLPMEEDFLSEDTPVLNEEDPVWEDDTQEVEIPAEVQPENPAEVQPENPVEQGNTVIVGSNPVDISGRTQNSGNQGGSNIGSGNTDISAEVDGNNVFIN